VTAQLLAMTRAERAALPFMHPGRVDIIGGGAMILDAIVRAGSCVEVVVSETDILDGIVYRMRP
jgi:exopolyphosphatase/guanosine-5'-triphosphate,3'-diphosphate pyrophosphatase